MGGGCGGRGPYSGCVSGEGARSGMGGGRLLVEGAGEDSGIINSCTQVIVRNAQLNTV